MQSLAALADPTRRRIVEMLAGGELAAGTIADRFAISAPAISQHLKVLKDARLVRARILAQHRIYALDPTGFAEVERWLAGIRRFWEPRLDALERTLRATAREPGRKSKEAMKGRTRRSGR
jgi:DNA-binding transcriptional ArsR family regulator